MDDLKLAFENNDPDLVLITEVIPKAQKNPIHEPLLSISGYNVFTNFKFDEPDLGCSGKRGIAVYIRNSIDCDQIVLEKCYDDHLWVEIKLRSNEKLLCGCIYRSPTKDKESLKNSTLAICDIINEITARKPTYLLICGDFNYPEIDWKNEYVDSTSTILPFIDCIQDNHLYQHVNKPTRYRHGHEPSLLDLILTSEEDMMSELIHKPGLGGSDHECLHFVFNCETENVIKPTHKNFRKADYTKIRTRLDVVDWGKVLEGNFEESYYAFCDTVEKATYGCIPDTTPAKRPKNIYLTPEAIRKKELKNRLWKRYKKSRTPYNNNRFVHARNDLRSLTRKLRREFERKIASEIKTSPKQFWSYVKSKTKCRQKIPPLKRTDGSFASSTVDKAETLNTFFSSVFTKENHDNIPDEIAITSMENPLDTFDISADDILKKLQNLKPGKSPGPDSWHPFFLKSIADQICMPLSMIFQKSLNESIVPEDWRKAHVTAIFKKGEKNLPSNYRPISLTSILCKLMESIVRDKIVQHMQENNLFYTSQHGFILSKNCMTNLLLCMEKWSEILENGDAVDVIYTDFSKAFDSVPHQRLLLKMKNLGITGKSLKWVEAFISNRKQRVRVDNSLSSWKDVVSGIPQGSVLGPILFVIFINDMPGILQNICQLFADDAKIFTAVNVRSDVEPKVLQDDLQKLCEWSKKWQLPFNTDKCKSLHIGKQNPFHKYKMNDKTLKQVYEEKDLGVVMDSDLKFHKQSAAAAKTANRILGIIKKSFAYLERSTVTTLYKSMVRPHLEYGNVIWGPTYQGDKLLLEKVQRRATKMVKDLKDLPYAKRLELLELPSLQYRRLRGDMIYTYKIITEKVDIDRSNFFDMRKSSTRGHQYKITKKKATIAARINNFSNRIIDEWNKLPSRILTAETTDKFKNKLDDVLVKRMYEHP